jgi:hypothetical protein
MVTSKKQQKNYYFHIDKLYQLDYIQHILIILIVYFYQKPLLLERMTWLKKIYGEPPVHG